MSKEVSKTSSSFWGAFWGAFLAFIFGLITLYITKKRELYIKHKNALVKLEQLLHEHFDEIDMSKTNASSTKSITLAGNMTDYRFSLFKTPSDISLELQSLEMINRYFGYSRMATRINANTAAKNHALTRFEDGSIAGRPPAAQSMKYVADSMDQILTGLNKMEEEALDLLARTRLYIRKCNDKYYVVMSSITRNWNIEISDEDIKNEIKKLK